MTSAYDLATIRNLLNDAFSSGEISTLAFDLFQPVYRNFASGMDKAEMIKRIVDYASEHGQIALLLDYVKRENQYQHSRYADRLKPTFRVAQPEPAAVPPAKDQPVEDHDKLDYKNEDQSWYAPEFPETREIDSQQARQLQGEIDVVVMTATEEELKAVMHQLQPYPRRRDILHAYIGPETYYLGKFGTHRIVVTRSRMGSGGESGSTLATESALREWRPRAIVMTGIAFGKDPAKQNIGDVLVASQIIPYEKQRVGAEVIFRDPIPPSNATLLNRFENATRWRFVRPDGERCRLRSGPVLSGEKLVDDPGFKAFLFQRFPEAIGGEMEGAGLAAAAGRAGVPWILVKAICDWGNGKKHGRFQSLAAAASASLVHHVLSQKTVLNSIPKRYESEEVVPSRPRQKRNRTVGSKKTSSKTEEDEPEPGSRKQDLSPRPHFYANASYGLEAGFTGRTAELSMLDNWLANDPDHPLLALIALGGTGKSALAWYWQQRLAVAACEPPLQAIIWWDFYQPSAGVAEFLTDALTFFGDEPQRYGNPRLQVNRLFEHLRRTPLLLILDGAERLLRVYSRMDAAYLDDAEAEVGRPHGRDCVDPVAANLLTGLAQMQGQTKTLLTSRLLPRELEGRGGGLLQGVYRHDLTGLDLEDAYHLFKERGVQATRAEVQAVAGPLGYHPLSLALLAGYVADDPRAPNDLRVAANYDPTDDLLGRQQHVLKQAYDSLPPRARHLLSRLAAFRGGVTWETIEAIMGGGKRVQDDLSLLQRRGLLQRTVRGGATSYDLHPIVRRYAYDRLADPAATHAQLVIYFEAVPRPERVQSLADLAPAIELYHHLARAGKYDGAVKLAQDRLIPEPMYFQLGAYQQVIELLRALFPDGEDKPPRLSDEGDQAWTLSALASSYSLSGQPAAAVPLFEQQIAIRERQGDKENLAIGLSALASVAQMPIGALAAAAGNLRRSIELCREIEDRFWEAAGHLEYGRLLAYCGDWAEAAAELDTALEQFTAEAAIQSQCVVWAYRALAALLQGDGAAGLAAAQEALRLADETARASYPGERDYVQAYWLLGWARLLLGELDQAQGHLDEALRRCRAINMVDHEPAILLAQARLARAGEQEGILPTNYAEEALQIAERAGYRLDLADIHNFLAQLALDEGNQSLARQHTQKARDYAWCDGPPYAYQVALDEAERLLALVGRINHGDAEDAERSGGEST